jgi:hypothetical protein
MKKRNTKRPQRAGAGKRKALLPGGVVETRWGPARYLPAAPDEEIRWASEADKLRSFLSLQDTVHGIEMFLLSVPKHLRGAKGAQIKRHMERLPEVLKNRAATARQGKETKRKNANKSLSDRARKLRDGRGLSIAGIARVLTGEEGKPVSWKRAKKLLDE